MLTRKSLSIGLLAAALAVGAASLPALAKDKGSCPMFNDKGAMMQDGAISKDEFLTLHQQKFDQMDANKDGSISRDEMQAHRKAMKDCMGEHRQGRHHGGPGMMNGPAGQTPNGQVQTKSDT